jgi:NAD(P)-dependent dehydrogenase (short-subunit alcohol dehydrogenase family)
MASFFRMIYAKHHPPSDPTVSYANRTVIVTGANTGLGFEAAVKFVELGASTVILGVRSVSKGDAAKSAIEERTGRAGVVQVWELDMDRFDDVRKFAARVDAEITKLDVALLNAGVQFKNFQKSPEGWEEALQVNVLSTALLGILLLPKLKASKSKTDTSPLSTPHLTFVSSAAHSQVPAKGFQDIGSTGSILQKFNTPATFVFQHQYALSKLLLMFVIVELSSRAVDAKTGEIQVIVNSLCPGACRSEMSRHFVNNVGMRIVVWVFLTLMARTTEQGARALVSATALGPESHGMFWQNDEIKE